MSWQLAALNVWLRLRERPFLERETDPLRARSRMARTTASFPMPSGFARHPIALGGVSIVASIIGTFFVATKTGKVMNALYKGVIVSGVIAAIVFYPLTMAMFPENGTSLYLAALIQEALRFAERLRQDFRDVKSFVDGLDSLLREPEVGAMRNGVLARLRDQAIYHHDDEVTTSSLPVMQAEAYVLASGQGNQRGDVYYELADMAVLQHALRPDGSPTAFGEAAAAFTTSLARLATRFAQSADELIGQVLLDYRVPRRAGA